jgi:L-iditol 2-dehydrogenase
MTIPDSMRAVVLYDVDDIRIESRPVPQLLPGEMLVRTMAAGICTGDIMPWYIRRKAPCVLGHEPSGVVAAVADDGASAHAFHVGDRVFVHHHAPCFQCGACERGDYVQCAGWRASRIDPGAMAEYFRVPASNLGDTLVLPPHISFADGSLVEPLACVVKSLRRGGVMAGDDVYVIGLGVMGLMHVLVARHLGARVFGSDFIAGRRDRATQLGATAFHPDEVSTTLPDGARVVICGPGVPAALDAAVAAAAPGGTVVMFTPFEPGTPVTVDSEKLYFRDLPLTGSYSCGPTDTRRSLELISAGIVTAEKLGVTEIGLEDVPEAYRALAASRMVKPVVVFPPVD